jgi:hypothetical protein
MDKKVDSSSQTPARSEFDFVRVRGAREHGELDSLRLAARQFGGWLPKPDVSEPDLAKDAQ